jgi:geranylgeranyl pyrophosphate synthase
VNALATVRSAPGLDEYLDRLEERLEESVSSHSGLVSAIGTDTLAAGGKRLRPVLVFLCTPPALRGGESAVAGGAAVELVHMATLVHDDLLDGADLRRGRPTAWAEHGEEAAKAAGDYLFARAFAVLAATGDVRAVAVLADAALALARGEALQRRQAYRPDTTVEEYLARCSLKTGKLF